ncbi:MAG: MerR family transcriptional regulator [Betaproteobacteria bacterium]|nr:MerR family transcriptional regulator [Betaproteobacteria bacterium]
MPDLLPSSELPPIPAKRYFTIGEVSELCGVKPHVLRYWEQEFTQLKPVKRRGNRRYYQHHEVMLVRHIRELLYEQGFTINGARNKLGQEKGFDSLFEMHAEPVVPAQSAAPAVTPVTSVAPSALDSVAPLRVSSAAGTLDMAHIKQEIAAILELLRGRDA